MKSIFDTKEFLSLEPEEKVKVLTIELEKYEEDLSEILIKQKNEESEILANIANKKEQILEFYKQGIDFSSGNKLSIVMQELQDLKGKAGQIKQKSIELDKNKNALELKNLIAKKNSLCQEIEELKNEISSLHEQKIESQNSLVEIRANYNTFYSSYNEELSRLMFEEKRMYSEAISSDTEDVINNNFKLENQLKCKKDEIIKLKEENDRALEKCLSVEEEISETQDRINNLIIPEESKELIVQAKDLESEIIIYDEMLKRLDKLIDNNKEDLELTKVKYSNELQEERKIEEDLKKINESTSKVFENSELSNFEKLRNCDKSLADVKKVDLELKCVDKQIDNIKNRIKNRQQKIENVKTEILPLENTYNQKKEYEKQLKNELLKLQETREELLGSNCLGLITQYTNIGDFCPICKTRVTQKNHIETMDLTGLEKEIEMAKSKLSFARKDANNAYSNLSVVKAIEEYELAQIETDKKEIIELQNSKINIYKQVIDINDKTSENFENLKTALTKTTTALENIINLENKLQGTIKENNLKKIEYGTKISMYNELEEELIDLYYILQKERAERELLMFEAKNSVSIDDFEEKRTTLAENELKARELTRELINLYLQACELKNKIFANQETLSSLEYEKGVLETKLLQNKTIKVDTEDLNNNDFNVGEIREKIDRLKDSHKHLLSLKQDAENSMNNILKDYEVKTKLLAFKISDEQDVSSLVSSLMYRYGFISENEVKEYIVTDNMLKLKENEIKSYNNMLEKLELQREYLSENISSNTEINYEEYQKLIKETEELNFKLGKLQENIICTENRLNEYNQLKQLIEKYK